MKNGNPVVNVVVVVAALVLGEGVLITVIALALSFIVKPPEPAFIEDPQSPAYTGDYYIAIALKEEELGGEGYMSDRIAELNEEKLPRNHYIYLCREDGTDGRVVYKNTETIEAQVCDLALWGDNLVMKFDENIQWSSLFWIKLLDLKTGDESDFGWFNNENPGRTMEHAADGSFTPWSPVPVAEPNPLDKTLPDELVPSKAVVELVKKERADRRFGAEITSSEEVPDVDPIFRLPFYSWGGICSGLLYVYVERDGAHDVIVIDSGKPDDGFKLVNLTRDGKRVKGYDTEEGGDFISVSPVGWHLSRNPYAILNFRDTRGYDRDGNVIPGYYTLELMDLSGGNISTAAYVSLAKLEDGSIDFRLSREPVAGSDDPMLQRAMFSPGEFWMVADDLVIWQPQMLSYSLTEEARFPGYKLVNMSTLDQEYIPIPEGGDWLIGKLFACDGGFVMSAYDPPSVWSEGESTRTSLWRYTMATKSWELLIPDGKMNVLPLWLSHDGRYLGVLDTTDLLSMNPGLMKLGTIDLKKPDEGIVYCDGLPPIKGYSQGIVRIPAEKIEF